MINRFISPKRIRIALRIRAYATRFVRLALQAAQANMNARMLVSFEILLGRLGRRIFWRSSPFWPSDA